MTRGNPGVWGIPCTAVEKNGKRCNLSAVLSGKLLLCYSYADGPRLAVPSALLNNITKQMDDPWARSPRIIERCSLLFPPTFSPATLHAAFEKNIREQETIRLNTVDFQMRKINTKL